MTLEPAQNDNNLELGFTGARIKLARSKKHIDELSSEIAQLNAVGQDFFTIEYHNEYGQIAIFNGNPLYSLRIASITGNAVHNLRCVFDHIWTALHRHVTGKDTAYETFPFDETRESLRNRVRGKSKILAAFQDIEGIILDNLKPHSDRGGDHLLWSLTKLDKLDKHNMLIPVYSVFSIESMTISGDQGTADRVLLKNVISGAGAFAFPASEGFKIKNHGHLGVTPIFNNSTPLSGKKIYESLIALSKKTENALQLFERCVLK